MKKSILDFTALVVFLCASFVSGAQTTTDKPLLTIGCLSDLHNELGLINGSVDNVRLRGTITNTLNAMKEQENIDMLILGGDYTSDCTVPEQNWARVKDLIHEATQKTFPIGSDYFPVIYCTGNHDYEVANFDAIPKPYNAARYYDFVMKNDIGELPDNECFYEEAPNGNLGTMKVLAAYHYLVNGFDFVVLNCGKHYFKSAWDYNYTDESVQWVSDKLDEIYAKDPDKTVFFIAHLPFPDSNSISNSNKGISNSTKLKKTLASHPNVIFLYGHDHGSDNAYIRMKTSQRVTRYNADGNVISSFDDTHVDGLTQGSSSDNGSESSEMSEGSLYVIQRANNKYLGFDGNNAATIEEKN
ncbi:MAG: metallophosphoesterase, partial [Muribaculaceae bacterium]|nr:metallophosphoesterase [Muribaculaceae bacterium]